ncbi:hypothetical protein Rsub_11405 [Raphidocelis subcapitata]|uniref:Uncharacterized protein n=1 Tax=Raphidocelis subcapitata TaxID=307507 RepID=A0A2V0PFU2_9CHLO|nr:hypothetical protein Rsub_11405 [Raphidocelis subcapitata]|eukprot:GBF98691.1 hypothetical protein Rsub_11405 [Raphidocelis subcapitata]
MELAGGLALAPEAQDLLQILLVLLVKVVTTQALSSSAVLVATTTCHALLKAARSPSRGAAPVLRTVARALSLRIDNQCAEAERASALGKSPAVPSGKGAAQRAAKGFDSLWDRAFPNKRSAAAAAAAKDRLRKDVAKAAGAVIAPHNLAVLLIGTIQGFAADRLRAATLALAAALPAAVDGHLVSAKAGIGAASSVLPRRKAALRLLNAAAANSAAKLERLAAALGAAVGSGPGDAWNAPTVVAACAEYIAGCAAVLDAWGATCSAVTQELRLTPVNGAVPNGVRASLAQQLSGETAALMNHPALAAARKALSFGQEALSASTVPTTPAAAGPAIPAPAGDRDRAGPTTIDARDAAATITEQQADPSAAEPSSAEAELPQAAAGEGEGSEAPPCPALRRLRQASSGSGGGAAAPETPPGPELAPRAFGSDSGLSGDGGDGDGEGSAFGEPLAAADDAEDGPWAAADAAAPEAGLGGDAAWQDAPAQEQPPPMIDVASELAAFAAAGSQDLKDLVRAAAGQDAASVAALLGAVLQPWRQAMRGALEPGCGAEDADALAAYLTPLDAGAAAPLVVALRMGALEAWEYHLKMELLLAQGKGAGDALGLIVLLGRPRAEWADQDGEWQLRHVPAAALLAETCCDPVPPPSRATAEETAADYAQLLAWTRFARALLPLALDAQAMRAGAAGGALGAVSALAGVAEVLAAATGEALEAFAPGSEPYAAFQSRAVLATRLDVPAVEALQSQAERRLVDLSDALAEEQIQVCGPGAALLMWVSAAAARTGLRLHELGPLQAQLSEARAEAEGWRDCVLRIRDTLRARCLRNGRALGWGEAWAAPPPQTATVVELTGSEDEESGAAAGGAATEADAGAPAPQQEEEPPQQQQQQQEPQQQQQQQEEQPHQQQPQQQEEQPHQQEPQQEEEHQQPASADGEAEGGDAAPSRAAPDGAAADGPPAPASEIGVAPEPAAGSGMPAPTPAPAQAPRRGRGWGGTIVRVGAVGLLVALRLATRGAKHRR